MLATRKAQFQLLEKWMKGYKPEEFFDPTGKRIPKLADLALKGERRMGANSHANGGLLLRDFKMPGFQIYAVEVPLR